MLEGEQPPELGLSGTLVIKSLEIKNFRCFRNASLSDLGRVNVIVGENGSGKTTLLESLFLLGGNTPDVTLRLRTQRGMGEQMAVQQDRPLVEELWGDLFNDLDLDRPIRISMTDSDGPARSVVAKRSNGGGAQVHLPLDGKPTLGVPIEFIWSSGERSAEATIRLSSGGLTLNASGDLAVLPLAYFHNGMASPGEAASRFSELSKGNKEDAFNEKIHDLYPMVRRLSVEANAGQVMLYARVHGAPVKLPLAAVSQGINKVVQLLLGIEVAQNGIVLIDELDSGLYYKTLPEVWSALLTAARRAHAQLFITTHSRECLAALADVMRNHEDEFRLIRGESKENEHLLTLFSGDQFEAALSQEIEVR
jgi:predicted ATPase